MLPIIFASLGWTTLYLLLLKTSTTITKEAGSRLLALLHSFTICRLIEIFILWPQQQQQPFAFAEFGQPSTEIQNAVLVFSISYFVFETAYCVFSRTEDAVMMLHHVVSVSALGWSYHSGRSGYEVCLLIWCAEFTNPFLQLRVFLRSRGMHASVVGVLNEGVFVVLFVLMRGFFGVHYTWHVYKTAEKTGYVMRCFGYAFQIVNFMFLVQIGKLVKRRLCPTKKDRD